MLLEIIMFVKVICIQYTHTKKMEVLFFKSLFFFF